jgi:hypothetical protein
MKVLYNTGGEYGDCIVKHFDLMDYNNDETDKVLFWGWNSVDKDDVKEQYESANKKIFINTVQPCDVINGPIEMLKQSYFDEVFTICPYTAHVLNTTPNKISDTIYTPICFPFREKHFNKYKNITIADKEKDVIYYGNLHHVVYGDLLKSISKFNYAFSTVSPTLPTEEMANLVTHFDISSEEKWDLLSKCKINVGFNLLFLNPTHISNLKMISNIEAFKNIDITYEKRILPQMKTRMIESAACKTLMLMYKDDWNVIEEWFEPNKHFLYWESFEELESLIADITNNYEKYWHIVEAANEHVQQYSIENLINKIK